MTERHQLSLDPKSEDLAMQIAIIELLDEHPDPETYLGARTVTLSKSHLEARDLKAELMERINVFEALEAIKQAKQTASMIFSRKKS